MAVFSSLGRDKDVKEKRRSQEEHLSTRVLYSIRSYDCFLLLNYRISCYNKKELILVIRSLKLGSQSGFYPCHEIYRFFTYLCFQGPAQNKGGLTRTTGP